MVCNAQSLKIEDQFAERKAFGNEGVFPLDYPILNLSIYNEIPYASTFYVLDTTLPSPKPRIITLVKVDTAYLADTFDFNQRLEGRHFNLDVNDDYVALDDAWTTGNTTFVLDISGNLLWERDTVLSFGPSAQFSFIEYSDLSIFKGDLYNISTGSGLSSIFRRFKIQAGERLMEHAFADSLANYHLLNDGNDLFLICNKMYPTGTFRSLDHLFISKIDTAGNFIWSSEVSSPNNRYLIPEIVELKGNKIYIAAKHFYFQHYVELFCYNKSNGNLEWSRVIEGNMPEHVDVHNNNVHVSTNLWPEGNTPAAMYLYRLDTTGNLIDSIVQQLPDGNLAGAATDSLNFTFTWEIKDSLPYLKVYDPNYNTVINQALEPWYIGGLEPREESFPISKFRYDQFKMDSKGRVYIGTLHHPDTDTLTYKTISVRRVLLKDRPEVVDSATISSIEKMSSKNSFMLYPNPNTGSFTIKYSFKEENNSLVIYDLYGKVIRQVGLSKTKNEMRFNLDEVASGIYYYQVVSRERQMIKSGKLMIQN